MRAQRFLSKFGRRGLCGAASIAACVLLAPAPAAAQSFTVNLSLEAPPECGSAERVRAGVEEMVHKAPKEPLQASLTIRRFSEGYVAELRTQGATLREVSAPSCEGVVEAATVILALAIDPSAERRAPMPVRLAKPVAAPPPRPLRERLRFEAGASSTFDSSTLPHVASGARLRTGVVARGWSTSLEFTYWLPATASISDSPQIGGRFTWWTLGISGCLAPLATRPFSLCLSPELGRLEGSGLGGRTNQSPAAAWFAIALAPELGFSLTSHMRLRASAGMAVTVLGRHTFVLERSGEAVEVHHPGRVSARGGLGLDVIF